MSNFEIYEYTYPADGYWLIIYVYPYPSVYCSLITWYIFMSVIICAYVWICIWHYAYLNFRVFYSFRVEGYAFECLRFCKFLLSQTLTAKKVALSFVFIVILMELGEVVGYFFFVYAFLSSIHSSGSCKSCELIWVVHFSCKSKSMFVLLSLPQVDYLVVEDFKSSYELFIPLASARTCLFCCYYHK